MNNTTAIGVSGTIAAALTTLVAIFDAKYAWGLGQEGAGAAIIVLFSLPVFGIEVVRYFLNMRRMIHEAEETGTEADDQQGAETPARRNEEAAKGPDAAVLVMKPGRRD